MNTKIESLAPAPVWKNFKSLTQIPGRQNMRPESLNLSGNSEKTWD